MCSEQQMFMEPRVAIMIPFKEVDSHVRECIQQCLGLDYKNFDIILLPDHKITETFPRSKVIPTGAIVPALKRNKAIFSLDYDLFASIDSDAFPDKEWLRNAIPLFKDEKVGAVGGPNLPPPSASLLEKAAIDIIYSGLGLNTGYYIKKYGNNYTECKELASSNLVMRRSVLLEIKGYHTELPTGEDTIICFDIRKAGKKIIYAPNVVVYHHRRRLFLPHLKRIFVQASDKVLILLKYRSFKNIIYFIPTLFVLFVFFGLVASLFNIYLRMAYLSVIVIYSALVFINALKIKNLSQGFLFLIGLPLTHLTYGLGFLDGLLFKRFKLKKIFG